MRKSIVLLITVLFILSGCATSKNRNLESIQDNKTTLTHLEKEHNSKRAKDKNSSPIVVSFQPLEDKRPKKDITYMTSVKENVSSQILEAIKSIQLFDQINSPPSKEDIFVISGEILKFNWGYYDTMISYIPGLNVLNFFALPSTKTHGEVEIYLELKDIKQDRIIFSFTERYVKNSKYNIYSFKPSKADDDLAFCFNIVLKKIKDRLLLEKNKILNTDSLQLHSVSESKKVKETEEARAVDKAVDKEEEIKQNQEIKN